MCKIILSFIKSSKISEKGKCIIYFIIIIFISIGISYRIIFDEPMNNNSDKITNAKSDLSVLKDTNYENKINFQIEYLSQINAQFESSLVRRRIPSR